MLSYSSMVQHACATCRQQFAVIPEDLAFLQKLSPVIGGRTFPIPPPTQCPECRQQRRYACRNDRNYYNGTCTVCKKSLITSYSPDKNIPVLCDGCFWGDGWDPLAYGRTFDFGKPFMEQFRVLRETVPRLAIYHTQSENSDYTVHSSRCRNCYMSSSLTDDEDVHYSDLTFWSKNCLDLMSCNKMELCYECSFCEECFQCEWCENSMNLSESTLCFDCRGSSHLVGCVGLRNQQCRVLNERATKEQCDDTLSKLKTDPRFRSAFLEKFHRLKLKHPHRDAWMINAEQCSGNYIWNSKNAQRGFNVRTMEDTRYTYEGHSQVDTMDTARIGLGEVLYDCASIVDLKFSAFCNLTYQCDHLLYCDNCNGTSTSFGSVSLKKHKHCILNQQFSQEEYEALVPKIIEHMRTTGEWGEFFPAKISPFGYNETKAHEWYPLEQDDAIARGWKWSEYEQPIAKGIKTIPGAQLPGDIAKIPDDVLDWAITCDVTGRPFRIIKQELDFYRQRGLPVPRRSPKQRHYDRMRSHSIRTLFQRRCGKCGKAIETIYAPDRPEIVYCEPCYLAAVY
jgi:hypothetical protein